MLRTWSASPSNSRRTERYSARKLRRDYGARNEISVAYVPVPLDQRRVNEQLESGQA
jgi:hypothetical protein